MLPSYLCDSQDRKLLQGSSKETEISAAQRDSNLQQGAVADRKTVTAVSPGSRSETAHRVDAGNRSETAHRVDKCSV